MWTLAWPSLVCSANLYVNNYKLSFLDNTKAILKFSGSKSLRNGVEYLKIDSAQLIIKSAQLKVYFHNLFNGQKALEQAANEVINQNIEIFKGEVFPPIENNLSKLLLKLSSQIFDSAPYNEIFPLNWEWVMYCLLILKLKLGGPRFEFLFIFF
jgi:hypothetical protein